ncbi:hypothetical protein GJAV_G00251430 [Gymnothorax javanicus]|nr:hypothetical protein GJAV_G00251430 [Gymnothorax javanicus]
MEPLSCPEQGAAADSYQRSQKPDALPRLHSLACKEESATVVPEGYLLVITKFEAEHASSHTTIQPAPAAWLKLSSEINDLEKSLFVEVWDKGPVWDVLLGSVCIPMSCAERRTQESGEEGQYSPSSLYTHEDDANGCIVHSAETVEVPTDDQGRDYLRDAIDSLPTGDTNDSAIPGESVTRVSADFDITASQRDDLSGSNYASSGFNPTCVPPERSNEGADLASLESPSLVRVETAVVLANSIPRRWTTVLQRLLSFAGIFRSKVYDAYLDSGPLEAEGDNKDTTATSLVGLLTLYIALFSLGGLGS